MKLQQNYHSCSNYDVQYELSLIHSNIEDSRTEHNNYWWWLVLIFRTRPLYTCTQWYMIRELCGAMWNFIVVVDGTLRWNSGPASLVIPKAIFLFYDTSVLRKATVSDSTNIPSNTCRAVICNELTAVVSQTIRLCRQLLHHHLVWSAT